MAEGGYEEGILEFDDIANVNFGLDEAQNQGDEDKPNSDNTVGSLGGSKIEIDKDNAPADVPNDQINAAQCEANNVKEESQNCEHNDIPAVDIERINAEISMVQEAHKRLLEEKNALLESLQSGTFMVQDVIEEAAHLERKRDELQNQVRATCAQLRIETEDIQGEKESTKEDLTEQARLLNIEVEKNKRLKMKKEQMMKGLQSENCIVTNLLRQKELNEKDPGLVNVLDKAANICELQDEITQEALALKSTIEDDLEATRNQVREIESANSELTKTVLTEEMEIQSMTARLKEVQEKKKEQTKKLEYLRNTFDKIERNKQNKDLSTTDMINESKEVETAMQESYAAHEEILSILRQQQIEVITDFDKQLEAVKRTKPRQQKKHTGKKANQ